MQILEGSSTVQTSTNAYVLSGAILDATTALTISFTIKNTGANTILWEVVCGNTSDLSDGVVIQNPATLASNAISSYSLSPVPFAYYAIYIKSNVDNNHGQATIRSIAKG